MKKEDKKMMAIIGIGELPVGWNPETTTCVKQAVDTTKSIILDAGISKDEIGSIHIVPPLAGEKCEYHLSFSRLVEEMGLKGVKCNFQVAGWWMSPMMAIQAAKGVIFGGVADTALVLQSQHYSGATEEDLWWFFEKNNLGYYREWERHYGINYESMVGIITQRYMYETGLTHEDRGSVAVSLRNSAILNPNARFKGELALEEILSSDKVNSALLKGECGELSDGATGFILASAEKAESIGEKPPIYILGEGHSGAPYYSFVQKPDKDNTCLGLGKAVKMALENSGLKLEDIDVFELYSGYPIFEIMQVEEIGLCKRGNGGEYFKSGKAALGGKSPVNTHGGIQQGNTGLGVAMSPIIEAVRQLRGEAGKRQVKDAKIALVTNFGNQMMDSHVMILGRKKL